MKLKLPLLFYVFCCFIPGAAIHQCFGQCITYDVFACIDYEDNLHIQGNQMWWVNLGGSNPGQHPNCSMDADPLSVNGTPWGLWSTPYTLAGVTSCMTMTTSVTQCSDNCQLVQAPSAANNW